MEDFIGTKKVQALRHLRRRRGLTLGTTNGCFDLLHPGHIQFLRDCKEQLGPTSLTFLIVLVNADRYCSIVKGDGRPIIPQADRIQMVRGIKGVGAAFLFSERTPEKWIRRLKPDVHFKGVDWKGKEVPESKHAPIEFISLIEGYSTTSLIERIRKGGACHNSHRET